jgi:hypothetical protein
MNQGLIGQMITYKAGNRRVGRCDYALDNGIVKLVDGKPVTDPDWSEIKWLALLDLYQHEPGCLFTVVPDAVADADRTDQLWAHYAGAVISRGYRATYVLQDGCQRIPLSADAVFIGGTTGWKLSSDARRLVSEAHRRHLWVHAGRVNSLRRLRYMADLGCHSVDGTFLAFGPDINLARLLAWVDPAQPSLFGGVA